MLPNIYSYVSFSKKETSKHCFFFFLQLWLMKFRNFHGLPVDSVWGSRRDLLSFARILNPSLNAKHCSQKFLKTFIAMLKTHAHGLNQRKILMLLTTTAKSSRLMKAALLTKPSTTKCKRIYRCLVHIGAGISFFKPSVSLRVIHSLDGIDGMVNFLNFIWHYGVASSDMFGPDANNLLMCSI
jgi:hypothetical protein